MDDLFYSAALTGLLAAVCLWIAIVDFRQHRIPDWASLPLIGIGLAISGMVSGIALPERLIGTGVSFLLLWGIGEAYFRWRNEEALGIGDAKLFAAAGAWLGWTALPAVMLIATTMGLAFAALRPGRGQKRLAFGPWLAAGLVICWLRVVLRI
ncbi:MAG: A24 family peptidase [Paracoccaceae bacterium]